MRSQVACWFLLYMWRPKQLCNGQLKIGREPQQREADNDHPGENDQEKE